MPETLRARRRLRIVDGLGIVVIVACAAFLGGYFAGRLDECAQASRERVSSANREAPMPDVIHGDLMLAPAALTAAPTYAESATIGTRQYETIRIAAPGYRCARDGDGWTCTRGAP